MKVWLYRLLKLFCLLLFVLAIAVTQPWQAIPPAWNPWAPLSLEHPMNLVTHWKLSQLRDQPDTCLALLETAQSPQLDYQVLPDHTPTAGCPLSNVVRVRSTDIDFNASFVATCPLLASWVMFEQQALQPLALEHLDSRVSRIEHYGSFACRNVYNRESGRRSQHATASAFDVAAFQLEDGSNVNILRDWGNDASPEKGTFLREVHGAACDYFGTVLGPDYNQPHENHFHLDTSNFGFCR